MARFGRMRQKAAVNFGSELQGLSFVWVGFLCLRYLQVRPGFKASTWVEYAKQA